ncbi:protein of unknown function [Latilactobacillus sakei]|nr:protein of unknown function [Latilactobacillus sakei]
MLLPKLIIQEANMLKVIVRMSNVKKSNKAFIMISVYNFSKECYKKRMY